MNRSSDHVRRVKTLYKTLLKLHRGLPVEAKVIGDAYVREEFKLHKNVSEKEALVFIKEWTEYAVMMIQQLRPKPGQRFSNVGRDLSEGELHALREEQVGQLYELLKAATDKQSS